MSFKSDTCFGKKTGKPLTEYDSQAEAQEGANYANKTYRQNLIPYACDTCGKWHLSPQNRQTPSEPCPNCTSQDGQPKESYRTQKEAQRRASILKREQGVTLQIYPCEFGNGWHLTNMSGRA